MEVRNMLAAGSFMTRQRLIRFLLSGGGTALLFLAVSYGLARAGLAPFFGNVMAYAVAFLVGYALQRNWTFEARHRHRQALPRYMVAQFACALLSGVVGHSLVSVLGTPLWLMSLVTTTIAGCASYLLSFLWVFSNDE